MKTYAFHPDFQSADSFERACKLDAFYPQGGRWPAWRVNDYYFTMFARMSKDQPCNVIGYSRGAIFAAAVMGRQPEQIEKIICYAGMLPSRAIVHPGSSQILMVLNERDKATRPRTKRNRLVRSTIQRFRERSHHVRFEILRNGHRHWYGWDASYNHIFEEFLG